jgi:hypothetical protein
MASITHFLKTGLARTAIFGGVLCAALSTLASAAAAQGRIEGSCEGYFDSPDATGFLRADGRVIRNEPIPALRDRVEVRAAPDQNASVVERLAFQERVFITAYENGFYAVNRDTREESLPDFGWVAGRDLLCSSLPLVNEDGISRKFIVRTQATYAGENDSALTAKTGPQSDACVETNGSCRKLTRFNIFYVYAIDEESQRALLMGSPESRGVEFLTGWVDFDNGYFWDTRFGLRPRENLVYESGSGVLQEGEERRACLYQTLEEAAAASDEDACFVPILGGDRWFKYSLRIPIFDRVEHEGRHFYHVALPSAGVGEDAAEDVLTQVQGLDAAIAALSNLTNLDVFFLIDGTQSMQPHIDSIIGTEGKKGVLEAIQSAFENDPRFSKVRVRYGYRVYRDHYAGDFGIGEGMPFDNNCDPTPEDLLVNHETFQEEIRKIDTEFGNDSGVRDTDHEENLILGLAFAADDMVTCTQNTKLLFVLGDTGYDLETQKERGTPIDSEEEVLGYLTQSFSTEVDPIIPFFIQVPSVADQLNLSGSRREAYESAYQKFTDQARFFTQRIGQHFLSSLKGTSEANISEHYFSLDGRNPEEAQAELVEFVLERVSGFGDQRPVNEIIAELQGGAALVDIISALQSDDDASVPALRLAQIEKRVCEELGDACTERVFNDVTEGYIEDNEDVVLDVWLFSDEFRNWQLKLDVMAQLNQMSASELSRAVVRMMVDGLKNATGDTLEQVNAGDLSPGDLNLSMAEFLKRKHGLPTRSQSPLLNYTVGDFVYLEDRSSERGTLVEVCELYRVARWLLNHREVFAAVDDTEIPLFTLEESTGCNMRHPTPEFVYEGRERFPERTMSFRHEQMNTGFFWVPNAYLP